MSEMTTDEVAEYLRLHKSTIYRLVHEGLPGFQVGADWRFRRADIERWIDQQRDNRGSAS